MTPLSWSTPPRWWVAVDVGGFSLHHRTLLHHVQGNLTRVATRDDILQPILYQPCKPWDQAPYYRTTTPLCTEIRSCRTSSSIMKSPGRTGNPAYPTWTSMHTFETSCGARSAPTSLLHQTSTSCSADCLMSDRRPPRTLSRLWSGPWDNAASTASMPMVHTLAVDCCVSERVSL